MMMVLSSDLRVAFSNKDKGKRLKSPNPENSGNGLKCPIVKRQQPFLLLSKEEYPIVIGGGGF